MAKVFFRLAPASGSAFSQPLFEGARRQIAEQIRKRLLANKTNLRNKIGEYLASVFLQTPIARGLMGDKSEADLPAELGLTDEEAAELADGMAKLIRKAVFFRKLESKVVPKGAGPFVVCTVEAVPKDWKEYMGLPGAQYVSYNRHGHATIIPVMKWMLLDPNIDIGQAAYDIAFAGGAFDKSVTLHSRSGRALMLRLGALQALGESYRPGGYMLPAMFQHVGGENFIEYTLGQQGVAQLVGQIIRSVL